MQDFIHFIPRHPLLFGLMLIGFILLIIVEYFRGKNKSIYISPERAVTLFNHENARVFDLRSQENYQAGHVVGALLATSKDFEQSKKIEKWKINPVVLICETGLDSRKLALQLLTKGFNVYAIRGGMRAWKEAELPLIKEV